MAGIGVTRVDGSMDGWIGGGGMSGVGTRQGFENHDGTTAASGGAEGAARGGGGGEDAAEYFAVLSAQDDVSRLEAELENPCLSKAKVYALKKELARARAVIRRAEIRSQKK